MTRPPALTLLVQGLCPTGEHGPMITDAGPYSDHLGETYCDQCPGYWQHDVTAGRLELEYVFPSDGGEPLSVTLRAPRGHEYDPVELLRASRKMAGVG